MSMVIGGSNLEKYWNEKVMRYMSVLILLVAVNIMSPLWAKDKLIFSGIKGSVNSDISFMVLKEAYAELAIQVEYLPLPGERSLRTSNDGEVDGEVFRIANIEKRYANLIPVPTSINVLEGIAFSKNIDFTVNNWESLRPYTIGIQVGIKFAERGTNGMNRIMVDTNEQLFRMLNNDRLDIAVAALANGMQTLNKLNYPQIRALSPAILQFPLYHYLHKKNRNLVQDLNAVLLEMKKQGRMQVIRSLVLEQLKNSSN